jgi:endonuclease/exonuclease/phosphatase family metal-dependent hydrolase/glycosyltransferase involved in cell wall biosynthesis
MLTNTYLPHVGGVARSVHAFAEAYRRLGHRVLVVAPQFEGAPHDERDVIRVPAIQNFNGSDFSVRLPVPGLVTGALAEFHPDVIHAHHPFLLGDTALRIAASRNLPLVFTHHTMYERYTHYVPGNSPAMARFVTNLATGYANLCDRVLAPSESVAAVLKERGVTTPIEVVPTGVDTALFAEGDGAAFRRRLEIPADAFVVGHVGRLAPEKNLGFLADAVAAYVRRQHNAHFLVVGSGPSQAEIERLFDRHRIGARLHFAGTCSGQDLVDAFHAMDVFAFASHTETQGMVLTEAMAAGVPVVALDAPGAREVVVDGKNGRLLSSQSVRRFGHALHWVTAGGPERRAALVGSARETAQRFSMDNSAAKALAVYQDVAALGARAKQTEDSAWEVALRWIEGEWELLTNMARAASTALAPPGLWRVPGVSHLIRAWARVRRWANRREWGIRLLRLGTSEGTAAESGLVLIQIDGLGQTQFERALHRGRLPVIRRLMAKEGYQLHTMYSGLPSSTPAVQGELFYGVKTAVPTFSFRDIQAGTVVRMYDAEAAARVQSRLGSRARGLLEGGSAYSNIYTGGAAEAHFCCSAMGLGDVLRRANPLAILALVLWHLLTLLRTGGLMIIELALALFDFARGVISSGELKAELKFVASRVMISIWLREMVTLGVTIDAARGLPVIHVNFLGYDEHAHRRNPQSAFAHWTLRGIDHCVGRIWRAARSSRRRDYQVWIYADHGQEHTVPYSRLCGRTVQEAVAAVFRANPRTSVRLAHAEGVAGQRARWLGGRVAPRLLADAEPAAVEASELSIAAMGPAGHIYTPGPCTPVERLALAQRLVTEASIPVVVTSDADGRLQAFTADGCYALPDEIESLVGADHPFLGELRTDLVAMCRHPDAGDFVFFGFRPHAVAISFPMEHGAHGGFGPEETRGFALLPRGVSLPHTEREYLRPLDLRAAALHTLGRGRMPSARRSRAQRTSADTVRIMTYNIRNCLGTDGRLSPARIARVIAQYDPDVVALQEVDVRRPRSGDVDQVHEIAHDLAMDFHFYPAIEEVGELYGDAILSRCPMRLVHAGRLPSLPGVALEPRGALWVEIEVRGRRLQFLNTHLGLLPRERLRQVEALMGPEWLEHPEWRNPAVVCGDLNAMPRSRAYRRLAERFHDVQLCLDDHRPRHTFLSRYPLGRIDHIFISAGIEVTKVEVPRTELVRKASDHLPVVAEMRFV